VYEKLINARASKIAVQWVMGIYVLIIIYSRKKEYAPCFAVFNSILCRRLCL
jgi:hypothetical protein